MIRFVTLNEGKYREVSGMLEGAGFECEMLAIDYPEIQCDTLEEVVKSSMAQLTGKIEGDFLIDDSGLFISSLGGFPGVYSSYVYQTIGLEGVLRLLQDVENRAAEFRCCFGLCFEGRNVLFVGGVQGMITQEKRGEGGFGYDPIFVPAGAEKTFAEIPTEEKNKLSHRGKALEKVLEFLKEQ
ncbi:MAG: XTP/dITP diphosphatase [Methanobacteriota archaeon]|nr:MAG: XTP/dITP diphosphatase [Euryarchaeota archaeon]